jgi:hypothetical protein
MKFVFEDIAAGTQFCYINQAGNIVADRFSVSVVSDDVPAFYADDDLTEIREIWREVVFWGQTVTIIQGFSANITVKFQDETILVYPTMSDDEFDALEELLDTAIDSTDGVLVSKQKTHDAWEYFADPSAIKLIRRNTSMPNSGWMTSPEMFIKYRFDELLGAGYSSEVTLRQSFFNGAYLTVSEPLGYDSLVVEAKSFDVSEVRPNKYGVSNVLGNLSPLTRLIDDTGSTIFYDTSVTIEEITDNTDPYFPGKIFRGLNGYFKFRDADNQRIKRAVGFATLLDDDNSQVPMWASNRVSSAIPNDSGLLFTNDDGAYLIS